MPEPQPLEKATLQEITWNEAGEAIPEGKPVKVQFNPESLKLNYSNQVQAGDQAGGSAAQFVGKGTSKLSLELWFDATGPLPQDVPAVDDVRQLTGRIRYFMEPKEKIKGKDKQFVPPGTQFLWGSFLFDGIMESMDETLEFFSGDGKPLRASVAISLVRQDIKFPPRKDQAAGGAAPGTRPLQQTRAGETLQAIAAAAGRGVDWMAVAEANGIENPRRLVPGTLVDVQAILRPGF